MKRSEQMWVKRCCCPGDERRQGRVRGGLWIADEVLSFLRWLGVCMKEGGRGGGLEKQTLCM